MIVHGQIRGIVLRALAVSAVFSSVGTGPLVAQTAPPAAQAAPAAGMTLPSEPAAWINSQPYSLESLKGKAVFFYFFEEQCPKCRGQWPAILETAKKYRQEPIVFVAVNSGNDRGTVEQYAKSVKLDWPVIVDADRSLEKSAGIGEVSLQNIMQFKYVLASGQAKRGAWNDLEGTIKQALQGAAWRIDPTTMPEELIPVWRDVEMLQYSHVAKPLKKFSTSADPKVKGGAKKLLEFIDEESKPQMEAAKASLGTNKWEAYKQFDTIGRKYAGLPIATEAQTARKDLAKEPEVKTELAALKLLDTNRALLNSPKPAVRNRAKTTIEKLIADQPDSEAAKIAKSLGAAPAQ